MVSQCQTGRLVKSRHDSFAACQRPRVNSQWSVWYCVFALALQIYIMVSSIQRFTRYVSLPWPPQGQPYFELNAYVAFIGAAVVLMPFFVISALMKVGNYANDGHKIGDEEPDMVVYQNLRKRKCCRWLKSSWKHGGPVAPLIHLAASMCLLLPRLLIEAQLIKHGFISKGAIWRTDLDFLIPHKDRLVTLRFLATLNVTEIWGQQDDSPRLSLRPETSLEEHSALSSEFINYTVALIVYAVRYPAVFWNANKSFGLLFSIYLLLTASQQLLAFAGFAVLYKVHICGPRDVLLRFSTLLLCLKLAVVSFLAYSVLLTISGSALYFYGLQKYKEWLDSRVQCQLIKWKQESRRLWGVAPHLSAFLCLIASALCAGPLMYDYTLVYCGSLDGVVLAGVTGTIIHLFLWIVLWLILTIKHRWKFVSSAITSDLQLNGFKSSGQEAPLLVIDHGQTYQVREKDSKKAILNVVQKSMISLPKVSPSEDDDIYWLKPKPPPPKDLERSSTWHRSQRKSPGPKHKVIFQEGLVGSSATCKRTRSLKKSPKVGGRFKKQNVKFEELSDSDDGDYATLRDMTVVREDGDGADGLLSKRPRPRNGNEMTRRDYENLEVHPYSPSVEEADDDEEHQDFGSPTSSHLRVPVSVHRQSSNSSRRTDSGVSRGENGDITPRSGSISESSTSPEKGTSESSSGIHSSSSLSNKRASSMENVGLVTLARPTWKSMSLQRGAVPPPVVTPHAKVFRSPNNPLVIHRKTNKVSEESTNSKVKPFERATNIRMTSFTDQPDFPSNVVNINYASKSLQSYPTVIVPTVPTHQRRDSANYSLASSADSESSVQHS